MFEFREYLLAQGLADKTLRAYETRLRQAVAWSPEPLEVASAQAIAEVAARLPRTTSSQRQLRSALTHYWAMIGRVDPPVRAVRVPPKPRPRCKALDPADARALVKVSVGWYPAGTAVLIGLYLALRATEIAGFDMSRLDRDPAGGVTGWYRVTGKGDRTASLPVHPILADELSRWGSRSTVLFPGARGRASVTAATVWNWTRLVAGVAGVGEIHPHQLRHTALATMNDATGDLRTTQEFARHARPETTAIYTRTTTTRLVTAALSLDYLSDQ